MLRFVLVGPKAVGKSSIFSRLSPQANGFAKFGSSQTIPIPPALFSVVTLDFPSPTFSSLTQRDSIPQVFSNAHAVIFVLSDPKDESMVELYSLLMRHNFSQKRFILLHQIDKYEKDAQTSKLNELALNAEKVGIPITNCFATSLFDGSLSKTFSKIVTSQMPHFNQLQIYVNLIAQACQANRVIICDSATFLPICDSSDNRSENPQPICEYFLKIYPKKKSIKTISFECESSIVVFTMVSATTGIFVSSSSSNITTDSILFNIKRSLPKLQELIITK